MYGAILSKFDLRDYRGVCCGATSFPKEYELKLRNVKNQGSVNSCVAHALASVIEYYNYTQLNQDVQMSTGYIYGNRLNSFHSGQGMIIRDALATVCQYGDVPHQLFPYNIEVPNAIKKFEENQGELYERGLPSRFTSYYSLKTENDIKAALMNNQPVVMAMHWYKDITVQKDTGIMVTACGKYNGNHCMVIYGWNANGWLVQNSWGTLWGKNGRVIIPYHVPIQEAWGVIDTYCDELQGLDIKKPFSTPLGKFVAKVVNAIVNLFK